MKLVRVIFLFLMILTNLQIGESVVMEALIHVDSNNIQMTSFLERFKKFIAQSHVSNSNAINVENSTGVDKYIHHNNSFQANYDFSQNLLMIKTSYNLLHNKTGEKISNVNISINFRFEQDPSRKIVIEDLHGHDAEPIIGIDNVTRSKLKTTEPDENNDDREYQSNNTVLGTILYPIINLMELIIVTFFHIVVNGILGHVLTTAFEELYHGRLLSH